MNGKNTKIVIADEIEEIKHRLREMGETFNYLDKTMRAFPEFEEFEKVGDIRPRMSPAKVKRAKLRKKKRKTGGPK